MFEKGQRITAADLTNHMSCWIDTSGRIFYTGECGHGEAAERLGATIDQLEKRGWIHLSYGTMYTCETGPTQPQIDTLFDISVQSVAAKGLSGYYIDNFKETVRDLLRW